MGIHDNDVALTIKLPKELVEKLEKLAGRVKTSKQSLIVIAILNRFATPRMFWWHKLEAPFQRVLRQKERQKAVDEILSIYHRIPDDVQQALEWAYLVRKSKGLVS